MYAIEYSSKCKCFHIDDVNKTLQNNMENFIIDCTTDWQIIGITKSMKEAEEYCSLFEEKLQERQRRMNEAD